MKNVMFLVHQRPDRDSGSLRQYGREAHPQVARKIPISRGKIAEMRRVFDALPDDYAPPHEVSPWDHAAPERKILAAPADPAFHQEQVLDLDSGYEMPEHTDSGWPGPPAMLRIARPVRSAASIRKSDRATTAATGRDSLGGASAANTAICQELRAAATDAG